MSVFFFLIAPDSVCSKVSYENLEILEPLSNYFRSSSIYFRSALFSSISSVFFRFISYCYVFSNKFSCLILNFPKSIVVFFSFMGLFLRDSILATVPTGINEILLMFYSAKYSEDCTKGFSCSFGFTLL